MISSSLASTATGWAVVVAQPDKPLPVCLACTQLLNACWVYHQMPSAICCLNTPACHWIHNNLALAAGDGRRPGTGQRTPQPAGTAALGLSGWPALMQTSYLEPPEAPRPIYALSGALGTGG